MNKNNIISELSKAQEEITSGEYKSQYFNNIIKTYGLLNSDWLDQNINFIMNYNSLSFDEEKNVSNECLPKDEKRNYSYIDNYSNISIPTNFIFVTKNFIKLKLQSEKNALL